MSERVPIPTEAAACNWNSDGTTYPSVDPGAPKRLTGFQPKDVPVPGPGEVIPAQDHNWLWKLGMEMLSWLRDFAPREWRDVSEGITATVPGQSFLVVPPPGSPDDLMYTRYQQLFNVAGTQGTAGVPTQIRTDGEQLYYRAGSINQSIVCASPTDGSEIWEVDPLGTGVTAIAADGRYLYYIDTGAVTPGLFKLDRTDGTPDAVGGAEYGVTLLVANGVYAVGINGTVGGAGAVTFWTVNATGVSPTETGTVTPFVAAATVLAIDADQVYVGGPRNVDDVFCYTLSTRALKWSAKVDTNTPTTIKAIATDGEFVYVGTDSFTIAATGNRSLFCLNRTTGAVVWSLDFFDVAFLAVDDYYLHVIAAGGNLSMFRKDAPEQGPVASVGDVNDIDCDGISVVCLDFTTTANFQRNMVGLPTKAMMRASGRDPSRRPFHNLAIPWVG